MEETSGVVENLDTIRADMAKAPKQEPVEVKVETKIESDPAKAEPAEPAKKAFEAITSQEEFEKKLGARLAREQRQFDKQLREERDARIRAEARAEERAAIAAPKGEAKADGEPELKDYDDFQKYAKAVARWEAKQVAEEVAKESRESQRTQQSETEKQQQALAWNKRVEAALKELPDYREVLSESTNPLTDAMKAAIMDSEQGPQLAYYLATHAEDAQRIATLTPLGAVRALTLIEAGFKANPVSKTPEPISPTGARQTSGVKSLRDAGSYDEFAKRRRAFIASTR